MGDGRKRETAKGVEAEVKQGNAEHKNELLAQPDVVDEMVIGMDFLAKAKMKFRC